MNTEHESSAKTRRLLFEAKKELEAILKRIKELEILLEIQLNKEKK